MPSLENWRIYIEEKENETIQVESIPHKQVSSKQESNQTICSGSGANPFGQMKFF